MKVLHIDCSVRNEHSISRKLSKLFIDQLHHTNDNVSVDYLDLTINPPQHVTNLFIEANYTSPSERTQEMTAELAESEAYIDRLHDADIYVIGMPMYNYCVPSNFKAFIDSVARIGRTFQAWENGFEGLLLNKKVFVINTRGVDFTNEFIASFDHLQPYLKTVFKFIGVTDVQFINVHPVKWGNAEKLESTLRKAEEEIRQAALSLSLIEN